MTDTAAATTTGMAMAVPLEGGATAGGATTGDPPTGVGGAMGATIDILLRVQVIPLGAGAIGAPRLPTIREMVHHPLPTIREMDPHPLLITPGMVPLITPVIQEGGWARNPLGVITNPLRPPMCRYPVHSQVN